MEKVRYAKWRAADISKALREGRQPAPVSPSGEPAETTTTAITIEPASAPAPAPPISPPAVVTDVSDGAYVPIPPPTVVTNAPDDARIDYEQTEPYSTPVLPLAPTAFGDEETSFEVPPGFAPVPINASDPQTGHDLLSGTPAEAPLPPTLPHDSPTVGMEQVRGRSTSIDVASLDPSPTTQAPSSTSPTHFVPSGSPPSIMSYLTAYPSAPPLPPPPSAPYMQVPPPAPQLLDTSPPPELTPGLIAKAQKHCRFAVSALDYEDAEQARKELRAALAILGG